MPVVEVYVYIFGPTGGRMSAMNSLCRTCMASVADNTEDDVYYCNVFETEGLAEKLMQCSNVEIQPYDEYPSNVCNTCCINILDFCDFQDMCRESLEKFKKMLEKGMDGPDRDIDCRIAIDLESESVSSENFTHGQSLLRVENYQKDVVEIMSDGDLDGQSCESDSNGRIGDKDWGHFIESSAASSEVDQSVNGCAADEVHSNESRNTDASFGLDNNAVDQNSRESFEDFNAFVESNDKTAEENIDNNQLCSNKKVPSYSELETFSCTVDKQISNLNNKSGVDATLIDGSSTSDADSIQTEEGSYAKITGEEYNAVGKSSNVTPLVLNDHAVSTTIQNIRIEKLCSGDVLKSFPYCKDVHNNKSQLLIKKFDKETDQINKQVFDSIESGSPQLPIEDTEEELIFEDVSENEDVEKVLHDEGVSEGEAEEKYSLNSPSGDEEVVSDSDDLVSDRKSKSGIKFLCDQCPQSFVLEQRLIAHKRRHQGLNGYPCPRKNCTKAYNRLIDLRQHLNDHDGVPRQSFKCDCGMVYASKICLNAHKRRKHNQGRVLPTQEYVCETCGASFKSAHKLRVHQYLHVDQSLWPFKCDYGSCAKRFRSNEHFKIHTNRHYGIKPYACTYCDKRFCASTNLKVHINYHTLAKKWTCSICPKVCYTPAALRLHVRKIHQNKPNDKKLPCRFCNKLLSSSIARKWHERTHTGERPFVCDKCGRTFIQPIALKKHKETHLENKAKVKKFYCNICNHAVNTAFDLRHHVMKHTGEKPFHCSTCGVKFRYKSNLKRHQKLDICKALQIVNNRDEYVSSYIEISALETSIEIIEECVKDN